MGVLGATSVTGSVQAQLLATRKSVNVNRSSSVLLRKLLGSGHRP
jgi:hypothetical protein